MPQSVAIGFAGGSIVASLVLSSVALIGRLGDTSADHFGYWNIGVVGLGIFYGGPTGIVLVVLLRGIFLSKLTIHQIIRSGIQSGMGAVIAGLIGGIANPFYAATACVITFVALMLLIGRKAGQAQNNLGKQ